MKLLESMKECLDKSVIEGDFKQFYDDRGMHCMTRMLEMFAATPVPWVGVKFWRFWRRPMVLASQLLNPSSIFELVVDVHGPYH